MGIFYFIGRKIRKVLCGSLLQVGGIFTVEVFDKDGNLRYKDTAQNGITNEGHNLILDVMFGTVAKPSWYVGLIRDDNYTGLNAADTMASHSGWEEGDEYTETTRQSITFNAAASKSISNGSPYQRCYFTINATQTMKGAFLTDSSTKSGTAGKLFCTALFDGGNIVVYSGDVLKVTYTVSSA